MQIRRFTFFIAIAATLALLLTACSGTPAPTPTPTPTPIGGHVAAPWERPTAEPSTDQVVQCNRSPEITKRFVESERDALGNHVVTDVVVSPHPDQVTYAGWAFLVVSFADTDSPGIWAVDSKELKTPHAMFAVNEVAANVLPYPWGSQFYEEDAIGATEC